MFEASCGKSLKILDEFIGIYKLDDYFQYPKIRLWV